jgi:pimeloyl-ACP methyl ester carboxylesterase
MRLNVTEVTRTITRGDAVVIAYGITPKVQASSAVVLIHGLASNMTRWSEFVGHTSLANHVPLIRIDLRGHGQSMTRAQFDLETWSDDIAAVLDQEALRDAIVVGHSMGAQAALMFAHRHPRRVGGLVLIDPVFRAALSSEWQRKAKLSPLLSMAARIIRTANRIGFHRRGLPPLDLRALDQQARIALLNAESKAAFIKQYSSTRADLKTIPHANYLQDLVEMFRDIANVEAIKAPTLAILSTGATFADTAQMKRSLNAIPNVAVEMIECEHWPLTEQPVAVREMIERWIAATFSPR